MHIFALRYLCFFSDSYNGETKQNKQTKTLKTCLLAVVVAFSVVFCAKQVFTVPLTDIFLTY